MGRTGQNGKHTVARMSHYTSDKKTTFAGSSAVAVWWVSVEAFKIVGIAFPLQYHLQRLLNKIPIEKDKHEDVGWSNPGNGC